MITRNPKAHSQSGVRRRTIKSNTVTIIIGNANYSSSLCNSLSVPILFMMELIKCVLALPNVDVVVRWRGEEEEGGREVCLPASQPAKYCTNSQPAADDEAAALLAKVTYIVVRHIIAKLQNQTSKIYQHSIRCCHTHHQGERIW